MSLTPTILGITFVCASLAVFGLLLHYMGRVGRRYDMLCLRGLLASGFGLLAGSVAYRSAQDATSAADPVSAICIALVLCLVAFEIWREGLRRFRDAG